MVATDRLGFATRDRFEMEPVLAAPDSVALDAYLSYADAPAGIDRLTATAGIFNVWSFGSREPRHARS